MKLHANAALTIEQRREVKCLHQEKHVSIRTLAIHYRVHRTTILRWIHREEPDDQSHVPRVKRVVTPEYYQAVIAYRQAHPKEGAIRIAQALQAQFPQAHRGTIAKILQQTGLSHPVTATRQTVKIPVGHYRAQMDVQQLPAIEGGKGFESKISLIHLRTRVKYSEIHPECTTEIAAGVFQRALDQLPPFLSFLPTMR